MHRSDLTVIQPGKKSQIRWGHGNWVFLDIGFAKEGRRTCGIALGNDSPLRLSFAGAKKKVIDVVSNSSVNLVVEAPLSVCFDLHGNPKPRAIEVEDGKARCWYTGPGCAVMVAAIYLIRAIKDATPRASVQLFEGFISFKNSLVRSDHLEDVRKLRAVVQDPVKFANSIYTVEQLAEQNDCLRSAFSVIGIDCGIPVVIKIKP